MPVGEGHSGGGWGQALPPHTPVAGLADVGEDRVFGDGGHGVGVGFVRGSRGHSEETVLWVDGPQLSWGEGGQGQRSMSRKYNRANIKVGYNVWIK